jgi:hypothetical protein
MREMPMTRRDQGWTEIFFLITRVCRSIQEKPFS